MKIKTSQCPICKTEFEIAKARTYRFAVDFRDWWTGKRMGEAPEDKINRSALVRCPECHNEFISNDVRFFGILTPKGLKVFLALYILGFAVIAAYSLIARK